MEPAMPYSPHQCGDRQNSLRDRAMCFLTPREVERRYPAMARPVLTQRRALHLPPEYKIVSGCIMYLEQEIERLHLAIVHCKSTTVTATPLGDAESDARV
jgi:hypothetical protein